MIADEQYRGPVNVVAPQEATSRTFAAALGRALHRPAIFPTPAFALRALFGEAATVLLASQRVAPAVLIGHGFPFAFPTLDAALADIVGGGRSRSGRRLPGRRRTRRRQEALVRLDDGALRTADDNGRRRAGRGDLRVLLAR